MDSAEWLEAREVERQILHPPRINSAAGFRKWLNYVHGELSKRPPTHISGINADNYELIWKTVIEQAKTWCPECLEPLGSTQHYPRDLNLDSRLLWSALINRLRNALAAAIAIESVIESDGPTLLGSFRSRGVECEIERLTWRLLRFMWEQDSAAEMELVTAVWGKAQSRATVARAISDANRFLEAVGGKQEFLHWRGSRVVWESPR